MPISSTVGMPVANVVPVGAGEIPAGADATVFVYGPNFASAIASQSFAKDIIAVADIDRDFHKQVNVVRSAAAAGGRVITVCTGPITRDIDDVRRVTEACTKGIKRALSAGVTAPLVVVDGSLRDRFSQALTVALTATLSALYVPLTIRVARGDAAEPVKTVFFHWSGAASSEEIAAAIANARAIEEGRRVARDVAGGDPEKMSPINAVTYIREAFKGTGVKVDVVDDIGVIEKEYPFSHAVARASLHVPRHHPRIVRLEYAGGDAIERQVYFAGKGIVYDTGGADVKTGGAMVGMSRDKGGAAAAVGFIRSVAELKPKGLRAVAYLAFVRNSIGSDSYVADEILTSHAGVKLLVVNTDAEGRMVLIDLLSHIREEIIAQDKRPVTTVHSIATLTGHAVIAMGSGYSVALDNGPARNMKISQKLQAAGEAFGDPFEISSLRREDYEFVAPATPEYDVKQGNNMPSVSTPRGHQFPAAVMLIASGLDKHGSDSDNPIAFTHMDIGGSAVAPPFINGVVTGNPVAALVATYAL